ncbi:uncharacterized protein LOC124711350 [Schistocerca piceifrons]|uniref:uncharacterized protein LOC124711350 n=1 Tax=Schistocerca piceifrons TaxID=274613 RepID=UPI001F5F1AB8|nr:uncharacterized protein LOC124711350 [Schistocerca piceifrons]
MSDDHEGRDGCLERTSFPLFHPKKSKILSRTVTGSDRARKLDRYGGTNIEELEDEGYRGREKDLQAEQLTGSSAGSSNIGMRLPVPEVASADLLMSQGSSVSSGSGLGQYVLNPFLAMGIQLPQLALLLQQQHLQRQQQHHHHHEQKHQQQLGQHTLHQPATTPAIGHSLASDHIRDIAPPLDHSKTWSHNIPAFPHLGNSTSTRTAANPVSLAGATSNVVTSQIRPMVQVPRENQPVQANKDDSVSGNNSSANKHPFVCEICRQWFFAKEKFIMHLVMNHNMHYCRFCSELFDVVEMRDVHIVRTHLPLQCDMCESQLPSSESLSEHYLSSHDVQSCLYCGVLVRPKSYYSTHARKKHFISNEDMLESEARIRIFQNWGTEIGSGGSVWNFTCNLCGKERKRSETFGHFFSYHRVSLPCLMQLLTGEGVSISVQGTPPTSTSFQHSADETPLSVVPESSVISGNSLTIDENRSSQLCCIVCGNSFTQLVPKSAHELFCRGLSVCRVCEQAFPNVIVRNAHMLGEHGKLPCRIGCSPDSASFSQDVELSTHYWHEHNIFVCAYCKALVAADKKLFAEHLKREHNCLPDCPALQGNGVGNGIFQCRSSKMSLFVYCTLCDLDLTTIMKDINLLFKHFQYHKISVSAALELLENHSTFSSNSFQHTDDKGEQLSEKDTSVIGDEFQTNSNKLPAIDERETLEASSRDDKEKTKSTPDLSSSVTDTSQIRGTDDVFNDDISNVRESNSTSMDSFPRVSIKEKRESCRSSKQLKAKLNVVEERDDERSGSTRVNDDIIDDSSSDLQSSDEEFGISEADAIDNEYTEEDESTATEELKPGGGSSGVGSDIAEAEFDPHDVECVFTDTSDDECDDAECSLNISVKREQLDAQERGTEPENTLATAAGTDESSDVQVKVEKADQGDQENKTHSPPAEIMCEICQGQFVTEDGALELARHMNVSHGFAVSTYGVRQFTCDVNQCGESFGSQTALDHHMTRLHEGPPASSSSESTTEYGCPFCAIRSCVKAALRQHIFSAHSKESARESPPQELRYQCRHCNIGFWSVEERNDHHVLKHEDQIENFYKCCICQRVYASKLCLNRHMRLDHASEHLYSSLAYKCRLCLTLIPSTLMLRQHFRECHPSSLVFHCHRCNTTLKTKKTLKCHIKNVHSEERRRDCGLCGKVLWSKRAYAIHFRMKHSAQSKVGFRCRICQQRFDSKDERKLHYQVDHSGESPYHCAECGKGFASKSGMYGHRQLHTGSGISKCEYCGKEFTRKDSYNEHLLIHNGPRHKCPHCPKEFVQRSNLVRHIRIHTGEKPYKCLYCEKCFSDKGACNSHIRVHTREETCSCPYCGQTFSKKQKLKYHIRKHTGEGLMTCEICNKTFTNSFALKEHRVIHNRQTQILCQQCGKGFNSEKYLQRHVAIVHEPTKLFACPLCPKVFSQHGRLKAHLMTHTGVKHMKCLLCEKAYSVRKSLRRHLLEKHQVSPEHPQYKNCFYAMSAAEAGLLIPEGAGPFVPPDDDSTSQSKDDEDYHPKKPPPRKFPRKTPGRKGPGRRGVSKGSAAFEVYNSQEGGSPLGEVGEVKRTRRKYNTKKRQREAAEAAALAAAAAEGGVTATTTSDCAIPALLDTEPVSPSSTDGPARRTRQKSSPKVAPPLIFHMDSSSSADEAPNSPPPLKRKVGRPPKRQQPSTAQMKKLQLAGKKKRRVEAIVEILQKTSSSPSSASPREEEEDRSLKGSEIKSESTGRTYRDPDSDDAPVLAKILPLNCPQKQRKSSFESQPSVFREEDKMC